MISEEKGFKLEDADLDIHTTTSERLGRRYDNFGKFLNLVAFIALLLGCVGIASAVHIYIKEKLRSVAILKCIGATKKQTFLIYLIQIAFVGLLSGILGTLIGLVLQQAFPVFFQELLPVDVQITLVPKTIVMGLLLGIFMSVLFALHCFHCPVLFVLHCFNCSLLFVLHCFNCSVLIVLHCFHCCFFCPSLL